MQASQESKWTTDLRCTTQEAPKGKATRMKMARKKKLKQPLPECEDNTVPIHAVVEDVLKYMLKKEKIVAKINDKKTTKLSDKQEMDEVKNRLALMETNVALQFGHVEQNLNILKELFDDMKRSNEARNIKWETDLNNFMVKVETKSEKDKSKVVATLQKIHKEHNSDKKATEDHLTKIEQHAKKTTQSTVTGMQQLAENMGRTKDDVDIL